MKGERLEIKNVKEIEGRLKREKKSNIVVKLIFFNLIGGEIGFEEACRFCGIAESTGYLWIREWNRKGYKGIESKGGKRGRPSRLSEEDLEKLKEKLKEKPY